MSHDEFQSRVLSDLAVLKKQMELLLGNGQPGLLQQLREKVDEHERAIQRAYGWGAAGGMLVTLVNLALGALRLRR